MYKVLIFKFLFLIFYLGISQPKVGYAQSKEILVAAASDLNFAMNDIVKAFEVNHKEVKVKVSYGSSGTLFAQISNGAPFDVFFSADIQYPELLEKDGLVLPGSKTLYAIGKLVLWVPKDSIIDIENSGINVLTHPSIRKIAIANPQHAPYGRVAIAAMQNLGVYERVKGKFVFGENISQTAQFVQSGAADIGIIALSVALSPSMQTAGRYWEIPPDSYPLIEQGYVILRNGNNHDAARIFTDFFSSSEGKKILAKWGFLIAPPSL
ncbi:MAG: molybdate ABC transporter substrate-binding protein [Planctomycetes bacterium]|nr:molybdate ABC transporter substrate-binding protein [Planctomycetota bacterium]